MKKKTLLIRLAVLVTAMMCALGASAYDFTYNGYYYKILTDSTVAITYKTYAGNSYSGNVTIPEGVENLSTYKYYYVTEIDMEAFIGSTSLTSVTIPNTVTLIGSRAFQNCTALRSVVMGKNCSFYDPITNGHVLNVFQNCPNLTSITCWMFSPDMWLEYDGYYNFDQSVLNNATLYVPRGAVPNYQATEGWRLFAHIQEAPGDYNYDFYQDGIFYKFRGGSQVKVTYRDEDYNNYSGTVTVPATVTYNNTNYTVKGIGDYAFRSCGNLTKVNLPATIDSIGSYAFTHCYKLTEIDIPNGVTYIADGAFANCSTLKSIMFPAGVTKIYGSTCRGCYALETVWLPVNLTNIYAGSFSYCNAIKNIFSLNRVSPDLYNSYIFSSTVYENATLYIPEDTYGNTYTSTNDYWYNFTTQKPYNQYLSAAINAAGTDITFSTPSTDNYPWLIKTNAGRTCAQSGNTGIHSSTSVMTATVTGPGSLSFDFKAWGEGSSTAYDYCVFMVDGVEKFRYGARDNGWETYTVELGDGTHTLTWSYIKDSSVHSTGDYFAISNVRFTSYAPEAYACYTPSNTTLTFYYDNQRASRSGTTYDLNTGTNDTGWDTDGTKSNVTKVVFDPSFAGARPTTTYDWFYYMQNLESITGIEYLNTSEVTNMNYMFLNCLRLTSLDVSHFNTSKVISMARTFSYCTGLTSLDLSSFNTSNVNSMNYMFNGCTNLRTIYVGDGWSTATVSNSTNMFNNCTSLVGGQGTTYNDSNPKDKTYAHIDGGTSNPGYFTDKNAPEAYACYTPSNTTLTFYYDNQRASRSGTTYDLNTGTNDTGWDTDGTKSNVTKVVFDPSFANARPTTTCDWFYNMQKLQTITGMNYLNTSEVTNMSYMFLNCIKLTSLDVSRFNTSKVIYMTQMFSYCTGLTSLDVSSFNTSNVTNMQNMFSSCTSLMSLDLSSFNTSKVTSMRSMFDGCYNLRTVYVGNGWSTAAVTYSTNMFTNCTSLVGGQGTTYDANHIDKTYAHIDGGTSNPGYFTAKNAGLRGDVDSDGNVGVADVTALIDYLLTGNTTGVDLQAANVDGDSSVSVADVTALIDYILTGNW